MERIIHMARSYKVKCSLCDGGGILVDEEDGTDAECHECHGDGYFEHFDEDDPEAEDMTPYDCGMLGDTWRDI